MRNLIIYAMMILTLVGMFGVASQMLVLRRQMGIVDELAADNPRRVEFNRLHHGQPALKAPCWYWAWHCSTLPHGGYHKESCRSFVISVQACACRRQWNLVIVVITSYLKGAASHWVQLQADF